MPTPNRPPINPDVLLQARLAKGWTQEEVQEECARQGRPVYNLSRMESGELKWPTPRTLLALATALDLKVSDLFAEAATRAQVIPAVIEPAA
jgi:transcriptional regulator with XRE-family HTH domain